jgi:hypothetical protein
VTKGLLRDLVRGDARDEKLEPLRTLDRLEDGVEIELKGSWKWVAVEDPCISSTTSFPFSS